MGYGIYEFINKVTEEFTYDFKQFEKPMSEINVYPFREADFITGISLQTKDQAQV
jgi:hypothetical protein